MMRSAISKVAVRKFSTEAPRETVARNMLLYRAVRESKSIAELEALAKGPLPKLDAASVEALGLETYVNRSVASNSTKFVKDGSAWQNLAGNGKYVAEASRAETWPFLFGFAFTLVASSLLFSKLSPESEAAKNSPYMQMLERARGKTVDAHGHH